MHLSMHLKKLQIMNGMNKYVVKIIIIDIMFNDMIQRITSTESTYTINVFTVHFATDAHASLQPLHIQLTS